MSWHINKKKSHEDSSRREVEATLASVLRKAEAFFPETDKEISFASRYEATELPKRLQDAEAVLQRIEGGNTSRLFGRVVRNLRMSQGKSVDDLATALRIRAEEVEEIEADESYVPKPRTVSQLADHFGIAKPAFIQLAGLASQSDPRLTEGAVRFAASSTSLNFGDREQQKAVRQFVKMLNKLD